MTTPYDRQRPNREGELRDQIPPANIFVLDANGVSNPDFASSRKIGLSIIRELARNLSEILDLTVLVPNDHRVPRINNRYGSVATLELRRSLAIASAKLDRHRAEQTKNEAME